jgi:hypothetical protein
LALEHFETLEAALMGKYLELSGSDRKKLGTFKVGKIINDRCIHSKLFHAIAFSLIGSK